MFEGCQASPFRFSTGSAIPVSEGTENDLKVSRKPAGGKPAFVLYSEYLEKVNRGQMPLLLSTELSGWIDHSSPMRVNTARLNLDFMRSVDFK